MSGVLFIYIYIYIYIYIAGLGENLNQGEVSGN